MSQRTGVVDLDCELKKQVRWKWTVISRPDLVGVDCEFKNIRGWSGQ